MNTAQLLIRCLEEEGVEYIFGIPGEETLDLTNAIEASDKIQFITTRHEQGAAFMADVYGRLTGRRGSVFPLWALAPPIWSPALQTPTWMGPRWLPSRARWARTKCT